MSLIKSNNSVSFIEYSMTDSHANETSLDNLRLQHAILRLINCRESKILIKLENIEINNGLIFRIIKNKDFKYFVLLLYALLIFFEKPFWCYRKNTIYSFDKVNDNKLD